MKLSPETINALQSNTENIRNICILAHVDHGKTSLSDSLLATNGIISQRMAGKVRYLDSREDEQLRGITMEASAISLYFKIMRKKRTEEGEEAETETKEHLINLIDSPGHIDFSSEVSSASRLCDGAVVLVDVVEGVCSQTVNVLRQCWVDKLKPLLVINKIDRLITEWQLSPQEAYQHISRVIEQVNSVIGSFFAGDVMEDDMIWRESGTGEAFIEKSDLDLYFSPELNNVIFASAVDGWAFSVNTFAKIYLAKLGFSQAVLGKTLWGDFYLDLKAKKIIPGKKLKAGQNLKLMFVSLVLEQIWALYGACVVERDQEKLEKIIQKLGAKVGPRDLRSKDYKGLLNLVMSQWIPISHALLGAVIEYLPSPITAQQLRMEKILTECIYSDKAIPREDLLDPEFDRAMRNCDSSNPDDYTITYVSKMLSIPDADLPKETVGTTLTQDEILERGRKARELARIASQAAAAAIEEKKTDDDFTLPEIQKDPFEWEVDEDAFETEEEVEDETAAETLVAFTRIYSGSLTVGDLITVVGPKYDPTLPKDHPTNREQVTEDIAIEGLFLIMGRELVKIDTVPAGNIVGIVGLGDVVLKNATLITDVEENKPFVNLASTTTLIHNKPIMRITVEPTNPARLGRLERGLMLLAKADPVLEWYIDDDSGELIMCVAGELHLERCLKDLETRFAKGCEVTVKEPVIPFREGLVTNTAPKYDDEEPELENVELQFDMFSLPNEVTKFLIELESEISGIVAAALKNTLDAEILLAFKQKLATVLSESELDAKIMAVFKTVEGLVDHIICFGPKRVGPNIFVESPANNGQFRRVFSDASATKYEYENNVLNGFQLAMNEGPLAAEPIHGSLVVLKKSYKEDTEEVLLNVPGRVITHSRDLIHREFLARAPRLFLAMYTCDIQATAEVLGKVYAVVQKRGGAIISEEMKEGTPFFTIEARIPVVEAFGFSEDIRKKTSGAASPQLVFDGFDVLDIDPFWVPNTEEELEELGEFAERENVARRYMNTIRRRKGLFVDEKVVQNAEKQRTLKKD